MTHETPDDLLEEKDELLERAERAEIDGRQSCDGHGRHAEEEAVDIGDMIYGRDSIHDAGQNQGSLQDNRLSRMSFHSSRLLGALTNVKTRRCRR